MAQLTGANLVDEVRDLIGRPGAAAAGVIDDTRVTRWLNEGQQRIVEACPGLPCRQVEDATSWYCVTNTIDYDITKLHNGDMSGFSLAHLDRLWYRDGADSYEVKYLCEDEFDEKYPDPTHADYTPTRPTSWTRIAKKVRIAPWADGDYKAATAGDKTGVFRVLYTAYAKDLTTNDATCSDLTRADDGLISYATARAWEAIGDEQRSILWQGKFDNWLENYRAMQLGMQAWDGNIMFDEAI